MAALNQKMVGLGTQRSVIRELFEFGKKRMAEVGPENVFDFSIGNPSVPAPDSVNETVMRLTQEMDSVVPHGYTSARGIPWYGRKWRTRSAGILILRSVRTVFI